MIKCLITRNIFNQDLVGRKVIFKTVQEMEEEFGYTCYEDDDEEMVTTDDINTFYAFTSDMDDLCEKTAVITEVRVNQVLLKMDDEKMQSNVEDFEISFDMLYLVYEEEEITFTELLLG